MNNPQIIIAYIAIGALIATVAAVRSKADLSPTYEGIVFLTVLIFWPLIVLGAAVITVGRLIHLIRAVYNERNKPKQ